MGGENLLFLLGRIFSAWADTAKGKKLKCAFFLKKYIVFLYFSNEKSFFLAHKFCVRTETPHKNKRSEKKALSVWETSFGRKLET